MTKELVINTTSHETRVALLESGHIAELYIERTRERSIVGNIYRGRVIRSCRGCSGLRRHRPRQGGVSLCRRRPR